MKSPWPLRILALAGFLISTYLLSQKLLGKIDSIVGCGGGSGCANVLGSRWSQLFNVPVTALSSLVYGLLFCITFTPLSALRPLRAALVICFAGAALWFFGVLIFDLKVFCPWCTTAHVIGLTCALLLFLPLRNEKASPPAAKTRLGILGGALAVLVLIMGQFFGPIADTHRVSEGGEMEVEDTAIAIHSRLEPVALSPPEPGNPLTTLDTPPRPAPSPQKGRVVAVFDDNKAYNTSTLPHLGSADAPHVIVKYFDYTCESCKDMHDDLHMVAGKHPGKFCMIMLPTPLNRACNPHFPADLANHKLACELTHLSLAAWRANLEAWPKVHETLFTRPVLQPDIAEIAVAGIVGEQALAKAQADMWIEELIKANANDFRQLLEFGKTPKMPKLVVGRGRVLHGVTSTPEILLKALELEFKLIPQQESGVPKGSP